MNYVRKLPSIEEIQKEYPLSLELQEKRQNCVHEIKEILSGKSSKKLLIIGPCSADREDSVIEYVTRLAELSEKISDRCLIVPRVYTAKPRTNGTGYKGLLHRPDASSDHDDMWAGVLATRQMHLHVIQSTGLFCADEMLYPESMEYTQDLLAYIAVGARSVEDQLHRIAASGYDIPVGMKNPMDGDMNVMLNSIKAAQYPQSMIYRGWFCQTEGNEYAHAILRGFVDHLGAVHPNYHYEDLCQLHDLYYKKSLKNMSVIVDCNHANSAKHSDEQMRIAKEVTNLCANYPGLNNFVKGVMIESYLEDGCQLPGEGVYGKSITDACLGWDKTERLIMEIVGKW